MAAEPLLSVILPAHNEAENIPKMARRLAEGLTAAHIRYEVLFVNDGVRAPERPTLVRWRAAERSHAR